MISGLQGKSYEEKLKERRHQSDMVQTYKILHGHDKVKSDTLFVRADQSNVQTRSATGPMNLRHQAARLEVRRNFFSQRVVEILEMETYTGVDYNMDHDPPWVNGSLPKSRFK